MLGHLGFSYIGLIFLLLLIVPNILWSRSRPADYESENENGILMVLERIGEFGCIVCALMFSDFNCVPFTAWGVWLIAAFAVMGLYEFCWWRYFKSRKRARDMYRSFYMVPVPLAVFPAVAFLLLGIYGKVIWMILFAALFGIGHIGIHRQHAKELNINSFKGEL